MQHTDTYRGGAGVSTPLFSMVCKKAPPPPFFAERKSRLIGERLFTWVGGMLMSLIFDPPPPHTHAQTLHYIYLIESKTVDMEVG